MYYCSLVFIYISTSAKDPWDLVDGDKTALLSFTTVIVNVRVIYILVFPDTQTAKLF